MFKVMLVDDDAPMVKYLHKLIPWQELGLQIIADAHSGEKALQRFQETKPHLVITDIGMPHMDGIELADRLRQIRPDVRIIFLTCHEDFQYARKAIQLNADDYLIKDELTASSLRQSVEKTIQLIDTLRDRAIQLSYREELERNRDLLKQSFWKQLVSGDHSETVLNSGKHLGFNWKHPHFMLGLIHLDYASLVSHYGVKDVNLIYYAVYNIAQELADNTMISIVAEEEWGLVCVMNYQHNLAVNVQEHFRRFAVDLQSKAAEFLKLDILFVYGREFKGLERLGAALAELKEYNLGLYYEESRLSGMTGLVHPYWNSKFPLWENSKDTLLEAFRNKDLTNQAFSMRRRKQPWPIN